MKRGALALAFALAAALILGASPVRSALIVVANGAGEPQTAPTFQADDFNRCALDLNKWVVSDPVGDLTRSSTGAGTGDSDLVLSITPSSVHDAWVPNTAPFITQQVTGDITMEVKFATGLSSTVTGYGLVAVDASGNFLRFDLLKNSSGMRAFVGLIRNGSASTILNAALPAADVAPVWLRVVKASGTWTYSWSADGNTFSTLSSYTPSPALDEAKAGVFVSNYTSGGAVPAFTAKVDYFNVATGSPANEDVGSPADGTVHTLTLTTSGAGTGTITDVPSQTNYYCGETVRLTATPDAGSVFGSWSNAFTSTLNPVNTPPISSDLTVDAAFELGAVTAPTMTLSPPSISTGVTVGSSPPSSSFTIRNTGGQTLHWGVADDVTWLAATPTSGTTTTETDTVAVAFSTDTLAAGTYSSTITVSSSDVASQTIPVSLTVSAPGAKVYPDGSSDTGFNAPLSSLGGETCQSYCNRVYGGWTSYTGSDVLAAGATVECKTTTSGFKMTHDNITIRCSDVSAPGDGNGIIKTPSGSAAFNFLIEGNYIHDSHYYNGAGALCGRTAITIYQGSGTIQYNNVTYISDMYVQPGTYSFPSPVVIQWNYNHDNITSYTCNTPGQESHDETVHTETGNGPRILHNRFIHSGAADGNAGTACIYSENNPGQLLSDDIEYNLLSGGAFQLRLDGTGAVIKNNVFVKDAWHFAPFAFAKPVTTFSGNTCDDGHPLTLNSTNCSN